MLQSTPRRMALVLCGAFVVLALAYAGATPIFEAPDEGAHFLYAHNLLETGELPVLEDHRTVFASRSVQRHHPPLYYMTGALLISGLDRHAVHTYLDRNPFGSVGFVTANNHNIYYHYLTPFDQTPLAVMVYRLYSIALSTVTLCLIYRVGDLAFPGRRVGLVALLLTLSIPGFVAGSASINNDNLVTLLFTAGVYVSLRMWRRRDITRADLIAISLILPAAALSKLTGLALFGVIYGALGLGVLLGYYPLRRAVLAVAVSALAAVVLAGWWYARNWLLYGDPFALAATLRIWGRGQAVSEGVSEVLFEAKGIWDSFWMTLGHLSIRGPEWLYGYVPILTIGGLVGVLVWVALRDTSAATLRAKFFQWTRRVDGLLLLLAVVGLILAALVASTRQINVSQGRIVYPALVGLAPLIALGWRSLLGRWSPLLILPLAFVTIITPVVTLPRAFPTLQTVAALPATAQPINARADTLTLHGYRLLTRTVEPGGLVELEIFFGGSHAENPAFFVKALDPLTQATYGGVDLYPGMTPTDLLEPGVIYRAPVRFRMDDRSELVKSRAEGTAPLRLDLALGWRDIDPEPGEFLRIRDGNDAPIDLLTVPGAVLIDPLYVPPMPTTATDIVFGAVLRLDGYTLNTETLTPGAELDITLHWSALQRPDDDYTLTVALLDAADQVVAQADGMPPGYPTSAWVVGLPHAEQRALTLPPDLAPGAYRLYTGWYRHSDGWRLPASGERVENDVYFLPGSLSVR